MTKENMKDKNSFNIKNLSEHLFWDVDIETLDINKNFAFILQRILRYGLLKDWILLYKTFGIKKITQTAKTIRNLDDKSLHFIAQLSGSELSEFRCYTSKQSIPGHWEF